MMNVDGLARHIAMKYRSDYEELRAEGLYHAVRLGEGMDRAMITKIIERRMIRHAAKLKGHRPWQKGVKEFKVEAVGAMSLYDADNLTPLEVLNKLARSQTNEIGTLIEDEWMEVTFADFDEVQRLFVNMRLEGYNDTEIGQRCGLSQQSISKIGRNIATRIRAERIRQGLGDPLRESTRRGAENRTTSDGRWRRKGSLGSQVRGRKGAVRDRKVLDSVPSGGSGGVAVSRRERANLNLRTQVHSGASEPERAGSPTGIN